jgi:CRISPR-associated protein Cas6
VIIKGCLQPEAFLDAVTRQLETLGVRCSATLAARRGQRPLEGGVGAHPDSRFIRRTVRIRDREVVGYAVKLSNLDPDGSLVVQARGIGGRRKFGAGIFLPSK